MSADYDGFNLSGTMNEQTNLSVQFKRNMTNCPSNFCTDYFRARYAFSTQPRKRFQLIFFKSLGATADNTYGESPYLPGLY